MKDENIDKFFRNKFKDHKLNYKPEYWEKMDNLLNHPPPASGFHAAATKILGLNKALFISIISAVPVATAVIVTLVHLNKTVPVAQSEKNPKIINNEKIVTSQKDTLNENTITYPTAPTEKDNPTDVMENNKEANAKEIVTKTAAPPSDNQKLLSESNKIKEEIKKQSPQDKKQADQVNPPSNIKNQYVVAPPDQINQVKKDQIANISNQSKPENTVISPEREQKDMSQSMQKKEPMTYSESHKIDLLISDNTKPKKAEGDYSVLNIANPAPWERILNHNILSIVLGGTLTNGFSNSSNSTSYNLNPFIGFGLQYKLKDRWGIQLEADYIRRSGNSLNRSSVSTNYFLYKQTDSISLTTKSMDFIDFYLNVSRKFWNRHYFSAGAFISVMTNTVSNLYQNTSDIYRTDTKLTEENGYMDGLSNFNYGFSLEYKYRFMNNGFIGLRFNQTLNSFYDNKVFMGSNKDKLTELQLYLRWMLY